MTDLSLAQLDALDRIERWHQRWVQGHEARRQVFYLAGYAGTGKTFLAVEAVKRLGARTAAACLTGKAAAVLRERGLPAGTIHSLIYRPVEVEGGGVAFVRNRDSDLALASLLVVDEGSMVPDEQASDLLSYGKPTLVLADPAQLPPIRGAGFLTQREPDALLTEVHRQAADSPVLRLATLVREGRELPPAPYGVETREGSVAIRRVNLDDVLRPDHQVICGVHRVRWELTAALRRSLGHTDWVPASGERVTCTQNDREEGILNGMAGTVTEATVLSNGRLRLRILLDDEPSARTFIVDQLPFQEHVERRPLLAVRDRDVCRFDFAYVLTCHRAQGSEWDRVVVVDDSGSFRERRTEWLYTAVTRARRDLVLLRR